MFSRIGLESLSQRGKSPFYHSLVSLYQKTQNALSELKNPSPSEVYSKLENIKFSKDLKTIIEKYTGLYFSGIQITPSPIPDVKCVYRPNDQYVPKTTMKQTLGSFMEVINRLYDDRKGKAKESFSAKDAPFSFTVIVTTGMLSFRDKTGFFLTPEELSALTLHEIGHADHWVRTGWRAQRRMLDACDIVSYVETGHDRTAILSLIDKLKSVLSIRNQWGDTLDVLQEYFTSANDISNPRYIEALSTISTIIVSDLGNSTLGNFQQLMGLSTDKMRTSVLTLDTERSADDYAARNGAYKELVSVLLKFDKLEAKDHDKLYEMVNGVKAAGVTKFLKNFKQFFNISPEETSNGYDPILRRLELIVETAKHAFSDENLPWAVAQEIKLDIKEAEDYIREFKKEDYRVRRKLLADWKSNITKFGRIVSSPFRDRLSERYGQLQNTNRSLGRHSLYYLAKK